jgi:ABC-2 type transport system ATP-binding protein
LAVLALVENSARLFGRRVAAGSVADVLSQHATSSVRVRLESVADLTSAAGCSG